MADKSAQVQPISDAFRVDPDHFDLAGSDPAAIPAGPRSKAEAVADMAKIGEELDGLQERLYAEGTGGGEWRVLTISWNNPAAAVEQTGLELIAQRILALP